VICPSFHNTNMTTNARGQLVRMFASLPTEKREEYGRRYLAKCEEILGATAEKFPWDPVNVVNTIMHAITAKRPRFE
jgi:hypothetical protein